jgi:hypothetical protein
VASLWPSIGTRRWREGVWLSPVGSSGAIGARWIVFCSVLHAIADHALPTSLQWRARALTYAMRFLLAKQSTTVWGGIDRVGTMGTHWSAATAAGTA